MKKPLFYTIIVSLVFFSFQSQAQKYYSFVPAVQTPTLNTDAYGVGLGLPQDRRITNIYPSGTASDTAGNIYICSYADCIISKIDLKTNTITTIAGLRRSPGYTGDGLNAKGAQINGPNYMVIDGNNNLYVSDAGNNVIRKIVLSTNIITTVLGIRGSKQNLYCGSGDGLLATVNAVAYPFGLAVDKYNDLYVAEWESSFKDCGPSTSGSSRIRKINTKTGIISTLAGFYNGTSVAADNGADPKQVIFSQLTAPAVDDSLNVFFSSTQNSFWKISNLTGKLIKYAAVGASQAFVDPEGDLFLVWVSRVSKINKHTGTIQALIIPNGLGYNFLTQNGGGGGGGPNDIGLNINSIAFDKNDSIYLSGLNERVLSGSLRGGWKGGSDDFCSNANWDINVVPGPSMNVLIPTIPAGVQWPVVRCNTTVSNVRIKAGGILEIAQGYTLTADCITVEPGGSIIGKGNVSCSYVYIGQKLLGQRGWRVLSHPFTTNKLLQQNANINAITINTIPLYPANNTLDTRVFSNASNSWSNVTLDNIAANTNHALFIRGLVSDVTRMTYSNNPSATSYYVSGTLNPLSNNFTFPAPANANNFTLTGNPFPAPITSLALTGGVRRAYYVYVINQGATDLEKRTKAGGWSPVLLSSATTTIPALGVIQWKQPASSFTVSTSDLLPRGTAASSYMFGYESGIQNLELAVTQSGNIQDKLFVSVDSHSTDKGTDPTDLEKLTISGLNIYTIAVDKTHLAVDARSDLNTRIPLGINAENGIYNLVVNNNNLPAGTTVYLNDNFEHKIIDLTKKSKYNFSINSQAGSQGNNRFSLQILQNNSTAFFRNTFNIGLKNQSFEKGTSAF